MNAYELAGDAQNINTALEALQWVQKAIPMLLMQADEITALREQLNEVSN